VTATISARHAANRSSVVADMAAFLLRHHAVAGTYTESVDAALAYACGLDDAEWFALGILSGHYRHGGTPDPDTTAAVLAHLERLRPAPVADSDPFAFPKGTF